MPSLILLTPIPRQSLAPTPQLSRSLTHLCLSPPSKFIYTYIYIYISSPNICAKNRATSSICSEIRPIFFFFLLQAWFASVQRGLLSAIYTLLKCCSVDQSKLSTSAPSSSYTSFNNNQPIFKSRIARCRSSVSRYAHTPIRRIFVMPPGWCQQVYPTLMPTGFRSNRLLSTCNGVNNQLVMHLQSVHKPNEIPN